MKIILVILGYILFGLLFVWGLGAFITLAPNPLAWTENGRVVYLWLSFMVSLGLFGFITAVGDL